MNYNMQLKTNISHYDADIMDIVRAFEPQAINTILGEDLLEITLKESEKEGKISIKSTFFSAFSATFSKNFGTILQIKSNEKTSIKNIVYRYLSDYFQRELPYGAFTGIRPTKLYRQLVSEGMEADKFFANRYHINENKTKLVAKVVETQKLVYCRDENTVGLFVNIPFCPSRCTYCSFVSTDISKLKKHLDEYIINLLVEINIAKKVINDNNYKVRSIYIGGGTPTSIGIENLRKIIRAVYIADIEFTVEAGRPDTMDILMLEMMVAEGVTRISINPQTFNQNTLDLIGRKHLVEDIYNVYELAKKLPLQINMDLIAMLPNETLEDFCFSVDEAIRLAPDNITVHTLSVKRGSVLKIDNYLIEEKGKLAYAMNELSLKKMSEANYIPYYMYRQKNMSGNFENIGFVRDMDKLCIYNIDIMEEAISIIACGAGAISKRVYIDDNRLERLSNYKHVIDYNQNFDKLIAKIDKFWQK